MNSINVTRLEGRVTDDLKEQGRSRIVVVYWCIITSLHGIKCFYCHHYISDQKGAELQVYNIIFFSPQMDILVWSWTTVRHTYQFTE